MSEANPTADQDVKEKHSMSTGREVAILIGALVLAGVAAFTLYKIWNYERLHPSTDDAYLHANYVWISPQIDGQVSSINVSPNQFVKAGDVLFEIDPRQYQADLEKAQNQLLLVRHSVDSDQAQVDSARERLKEEQADLKTAQQYADRYQELVKAGAAAELDTIQYVNSVAAAKGRAAEAQDALNVAIINQGSDEVRKARVETAQADVDLAKLNLEWTKVLAPADGYVTQFSLRAGNVVQQDDELFPFIESDEWWVEANFSEVDVGLIEPGMRAEITIDTYGDKVFEGRVESLSRGSAASFSLLPPQNTTGNWVKVTQRIPVRIRMLKQDPDYPFRMGASVNAAIDVKTKSNKP